MHKIILMINKTTKNLDKDNVDSEFLVFFSLLSLIFSFHVYYKLELEFFVKIIFCDIHFVDVKILHMFFLLVRIGIGLFGFKKFSNFLIFFYDVIFFG